MSVEARRWADNQIVGDASGKAVLFALSEFADKHGYCYPGIAKIAASVELSPRTVIRKIKLLVSSGFVVNERRQNGGNRTSNGYQLSMAEKAESQCDNLSCDGLSCDSVTSQSDNVTLTKVTGCHVPIKKNRQYEPSGEPSVVLRKSETDDDVQPDQKPLRLLNADGTEPPSEVRKPDRFDEFWAAFPIKVAKQEARADWAKAVKKHDPELIIGAARHYALSVLGNDPHWTKHPHRWLAKERFLDDPEAVKALAKPGAALDALKAATARAKADEAKENEHPGITGSVGNRDIRDDNEDNGRVCESGPPPGVSQRDYNRLAKQIGFDPGFERDGKRRSRG